MADRGRLFVKCVEYLSIFLNEAIEFFVSGFVFGTVFQSHLYVSICYQPILTLPRCDDCRYD